MPSIVDDIVDEHRNIADVLESVGPDAPGGVGEWTAADLAAHLMSQMAARGVVVFVGISLVARGVRLNDIASGSADRAIAFYRRKGFTTAITSLRSGPPSLLLRQRVAPVSLFEIWVHHDDLRRANALPPPAEPTSLKAAVEFAMRYQRRALGSYTVDRSVPAGDLLRWLAGRPSDLPPHSPPLRF